MTTVIAQALQNLR